MIPAPEEPDGATPLEADERDGLRFLHITTRAQLNAVEQANIQSGLAWLGRRRNRRDDMLTEFWMCELHRRLFGEVWRWAGQFRRTEKNIGIDPLEIAVRLRALLDDARYWVEQRTYPALEAGARLHHRLVQIHPFPNGNGRHARIATDAYLQRFFGHPAIDWSGGADLVHENRRRDDYIRALRDADAGEYARLFDFVGLDQP